MTDSSSPMRSLSNNVVRASHLTTAGTVSDKKTQDAQPRVRRRNRIISSCLECRRRKLKCDRGQPCANCVKVSRQCHFLSPSFDTAAQARLAEVKEKMGMLERSLEDDIGQQIQAPAGPLSSANESGANARQEETYCGIEEGEGGEEEEEEGEDFKDLKPSEYAREDATYYEDEDGHDDDLADLGIALGKVRITERIGGLVRPKFSDELVQALKELPEREAQNPGLFSTGAVDWMMPSSDYVAPSSSFFFTPGVERATLMNYLPARLLVDKLMTQYWQAVHVIAKTVHRPSFERHYKKFWEHIAAGIEPRKSFQAVVFAALLASAVSMSGDKVLLEFGVDKQGLVDNFREATEAALSRANLLHTTKLETIQAFVMYLVPLCRAEVSRAHSALTGTCIRLAECMGLHKDPSAYSTSPIECQVRRLIWHQICFLDLRTCEATGPRPQIRPDDFDTRLPLNIDDNDLDQAEHGDDSIDVENDRTNFTDMTIMRLRFECYDIHRYLWVERSKLETKKKEGEKKVTINSLLARVQWFRATMEKKYLPMLSKTVPLHALASQIYGILSNRLYIHVLQKYLSSDKHKMPERMRQVVLSAAIMILEHSQNIEQQPALSMWSWYAGALHQYHSALLILSELYARPCTPAMEQRAWQVLDFAFELGPGMTNPEKTRAILEELTNKMQVYASVKRWRAPKDMPNAGLPSQTSDYQPQKQAAEGQAGRQDPESATEGNNQGLSSNASPLDGQTSPPLQQPFKTPRPLQSQSEGSGSSVGAIAFPGAIPNADWGTFDVPLSIPTSSFQHPLVQPDMYVTANYPTAMSSSILTPPGRTMLQSNNASRLVNPSAALSQGASSSTASSSPMNALNEIDWNEIEQLFSGAETGNGNVMIPPFTFPQFSATDLNALQWPPEQL